MKIAIASGKGGTGKTTVALSLARAAGKMVWLLDCDVEEPNAHLFFRESPRHRDTVNIQVPHFDNTTCNGCGQCAAFCRFNALAALRGEVLLFEELCHGCGGCARICPQGAIREIPQRIGVVEEIEDGNIHLVMGRLDIGKHLTPPIIQHVRKIPPAHELALIDAAPGTSCASSAAQRDCDFVLLVTEPTPFGLNDLRLSVELAREMKLEFGVLVNRHGIGDDRVHLFCREQGIPLLGEIPDDRRIAEVCSDGAILVDALPDYLPLFTRLWSEILRHAEATHAL